MKPLFPLLRSRRLSRTCLLATLAVVSLGQEAQAQCSSAFFANWHVCGSGTTIIEGKQASISLWIRRSIGVPNQAASFSITVSSSIVGGDPLNSSTVTIGATDSTSTRATFNVFATDTKLYEGTRAYSISARRIDPDPPEASSTIATIAGTIRDDESPPSFKLTARPTSWSEGDGSVKVSLTATLGEAIGKNLSVTFSASGTSDYKVSSAQTRTISQGDTSAKADLTFTPVNDDVDEPNASITVRARSNDSGIGSAFATLTQRDNDTSEALSFSRTKVAVDEGGTATYSVSLAEAATGEVTVSIAKAAGGDPDITVSPASLTFTTSNWSEGQTVTLKAAQDDDLADGTATINHTASGANYSGIRGAVTVTEEDDDTGSLAFSPSAVDVPEGGKATYSVSLSHEPSGSVTVSIAPTRGSDADITASPKSLTFTTSNWSTGQAVTVSAASDTDGLNGTATLRHTASGAEYAGVTGDLIATEQDKDRKLIITGSPVRVTEGSTAAYTLKLATRPTGTVTVSVSWLQGDSDLSATPASLSFTTLNWNTAKTVTVSAAEDDDLADGSATFTHTAKDGGYGGVMATATATEDDDDSAELLFSKRSVKVPEGGRATYTLRPRYAPTGTVTVGVAVADAGDVDITVSPSTLAFTTKNWSTAQTVTVSAREDDDGVDGSRQINHSATGAEYTNVSGAVTATEEDDDTAAIVLSKTSLTVAEAGTATYTVELATQPTAAVTVAIVRSTGDTSITFTPDTMTFTRSNWDDAQEVRVSAAEDDDGVNGEATLSHTASGGDYATLSKDASVTESDNDAQGLTLSERALTVREGGSDTYTVRLATQPSGNVTVRIARAAAGDTSITASPPSLSFTTITWSTPQTVTVSAAEDDDLADGSATFTHTAQGGGYGSVTGAVKATERDNDSAGLVFSRSALSVAEGGSRAYTVRLLSQPSARVTVSIAKAADGDPDLSASTDSLTFTTSNWNTAKTVTVTAGEDDDLADGSATFTHTASGGDYAAVSRSLTATEEDDDTGELEFSTSKVTVPEGGSAAYTLRLKFQPTGTVAVLLSRASGDLDLTVSPPAIVFTPSNWNVPRTLTLRAAQDNDLADGSATFSHAATGGGYGGVSGTITATEDDDDRGRIAFSKASVTVPEGGTAAYTVTLRFQPTATVTVSLAATGDSDITVLPPSLSFTRVNWNSPQTVTVSAEEDDDLVNGGASITHTAAGGGYGGLKPAVGAVEKDNDAGAFRFSPASVVVPEGGMAAYTVALAYRPGGSVTVALAATGDPDLTPSPASLTFTTTDWSTPQTVTVSARADDDIAPGRAAIQHTASGGGYGGLIESVTATEKDNDTPALTFSPPSVTVPEGGRATYTVTLSHQPVSSVAVAVGRSSGDADLAPSPAILTFSPANWDRPQSVRVSAEEDDDLADGSATIGHSALGGGYGAVTGEVMAREKDNDTARLIFSTRSFFVPEGRPATYSVRLSHEPSAAVTVAVARSSGDTDLTVMPPSLTFTTTNWETPQEVTVSAKEDEDTANGEAVFLHTASGGGYAGVMGEVTATESDNDAPGLTLSDTSPSVREGRTLAYTVSLAAEPTATVTVAVARSSGDTDLTVMPPSLTFTTTNWNGAQTLTVSAAEDDDLADGTATIRHTASGGGYDAVALDITATEIDNDTAGLVITGVPLTVEEGESATWTLRLATRPSATVTVAISRSSGDEDLSVTPPSLTFTTTNWNQTQEVTVSAGEDDDTANGEATFLHTASGGDYAGVTAEATAREMDNDTAGLMLSEDSLEVDEDGGEATYTVKLLTAPSGTVTVSIASRDPEVATTSPASLSFTTTNWNQAREVSVSGVDDFIDSDRTTEITHQASGGGYTRVAASLEVVLRDDDTAGVKVDPEELRLEEDGEAFYTLELASEPTSPVVVSISRLGQNVENLDWSPRRLTFSAADWNQPQRVTLSSEPDEDAEGGVALMRHAATSRDRVYNGIGIDDVEIVLGDDDQEVTSAVLTLSDDEIAEGEASALVTVTATLDAVTTTNLSIALSFGGTAAADDYTVGGTRTIRVEAGHQTGQTVLTLAPVDDVLVEETETIEISGTAEGLTVTGASLDLLDNDQQVTSAELALSDEEIAEGETSALVTVTATLDGVTSAGLSIALSFGGTATASDYDVGGARAIEVEAGKQAGQTTLTFAPIDDALVEGAETIIVNGASPGLTVSQATLTLVDDDVAVGDAVGNLSVDIDRVAESARDTLVTVTLTLEDDFTFDEIRTFEVAVRGSGEDAAVDFDPVRPFTLTLLSNISTAQSTFVLRPENDLVDETDETITLSVVSSPLPVTPAEITLVDDDAPPTGIALSVDDPDIAEGDPATEITLTARVEGGTTYARARILTLAFGGTATAGRDGDYTVSGPLVLTIPAGEGLATSVLTFRPIDDSRDELDETIEISATTPAGLPVTPTLVRLLDNDESLLTLRAEPRRIEEGAGAVRVMLTVTVRSGTPYDDDLAVALEFAGTAGRTVDYTVSGPFTFTLPAGSVSASTSLRVTPIDDTLDEPDETLEIVGNAGVGYTSTAVLLLIDNDIPPARIQLTATPATLAETAPATRVLLEARVEGSTAFSTDTEIALTLEGTAVSTIDYDLGGITDPLILPAGRLSVTRELNLTPIDDPHPEGTERILITGATRVRVVGATITLLDDDGADLAVSFTQAEYTANEYGPGATVVVTVTPAADRREVIGLTFSHLGGITAEDYRGIPDELVFEPGDEARSFTVEALPDQAYESGERIRLQLASLSPQVSFHPLAATTVMLVEERSTGEFSAETRTVLALSSRAWSDSVQSALEERFARARQTEEWGSWQPRYEEPPASRDGGRSPALLPQPHHDADRLIPGDWLAAWRRKNERRNVGLIEPRLSLRKVLARLKGWRPVLWAEGATHHFSGHAQSLDYQGGFQAAHVGLDLHSGKKTLVGASVMRGSSSMDYSNGQGLDGSTQATLYTVHPYLHFEVHDRVTVWTIGGLGFAPLKLRELDRDHDLSGSARMAAGGLRIRARNWDRLELAVRGDGDIAWIGARLPAETVTLGGHAGRVRLLAELTQTFRLFGQDLVAAGEAGGRLDRGGAHRGAGAEAGGRVSWRKPDKGLDFSVHGSSLLWHQSAFRIWGAGLQASWDPGAEKRGLVLRFASGRGPRGGKTRLFQETVDRLLQPADSLDSELELGYGTGVGTRLLTLTFRLRGLSGWTIALDMR